MDNLLKSSKTSSGEKYYKYFIGYINDDSKIKPLQIMLLKTSAYAKSYDGKTKLMCLSIKDDESLKNKMILGTKLALESIEHPIVNPSTIKKF